MLVSKVEVVILGLLAEGPLYGYELLERFRARGMGCWVEVGKASVYQALRRLETRGLVTGRQQEGPEGPDRRVHRITASGRSRLRAGLRERCAAARPYEIDAALALGFAHLMPLDDARRAVAERGAALQRWRSAIALEGEQATSTPGAAGAVARRMLDLQEALAETEQRWLQAFGEELPALRGASRR